MDRRTHDALVDELDGFGVLVELGVGNRPDVAGALAAAGRRVTATDVTPREVPEGVSFVLDDVTDPADEIYADADALYALNLPPELHRPALAVAREHDATFAFTTLGADQPEVAVRRQTLPGETLYWARDAAQK